MHQSGGLERVIRALGPHARGGDPPEFGVEKLDQPAGSFMVAVAKARHQPGYGIGLKSGWDRHFATQFNRPKKNSKATIQSAALLSHYGVSSLQKLRTALYKGEPQWSHGNSSKMMAGALVTLALVTPGGHTLAEFKQIRMPSHRR